MSLVDALDLILETEASRCELDVGDLASLRAMCKTAKHSVDSVRMEVLDTTEYVVRKLPPSIGHQPISTLRSVSFMVPWNEDQTLWVDTSNTMSRFDEDPHYRPTIIMSPGEYSSLETLNIEFAHMDEPNADFHALFPKKEEKYVKRIYDYGEDDCIDCQWVCVPDESCLPALKKLRISLAPLARSSDCRWRGIVQLVEHFGFVHTLNLEKCTFYREDFDGNNGPEPVCLPRVKRLELGDTEFLHLLDCPCLEEIAIHTTGALGGSILFDVIEKYKNLRVIDVQNTDIIEDYEGIRLILSSPSLEVLRMCNASVDISILRKLCDIHFPNLRTVDFSGAMFMWEDYSIDEDDFFRTEVPRNKTLKFVFDACRTGRWPQCDLSL
jgi:hypothetical protein